MSHIRKFLVLILIAVFFAPLASSAQTAGELKAKIQALLDQVKQLQAQLDSLTGKQNKWCHTFVTNLGVGAEGDEVAALENALGQEGFSVEHSSNFTSIFDERLAAAVTEFQEKYKDEILTPVGLKFGTGYLGPKTRAKLNKLYGCKKPVPVPSGYGAYRIDVKYRIGTDVSNPIMLLPKDLQDAIENIGRLAPAGGPEFRWLRFALKATTDESIFITQLRSLEWVEIAEFAPRPAPPPIVQ